MRKIHIPFKGVSTVPSDFQNDDGELALGVNLISENNELHAVGRPECVCGVMSYSRIAVSEVIPLFVHATSEYRHWIIAVSERNESSVSYHLLWLTDEELSAYGGSDLSDSELFCVDGEISASERYILSVGEDIVSVDSVGNTLVLTTRSGTLYLLWRFTSYRCLGSKLPEVDLSFGLQFETKYYSLQQSDDGSGPRGMFDINYTSLALDIRTNTPLPATQKNEISDAVMSKVNKFVAEEVTGKGKFLYPFLVRYALRLFDGHLVCHSSPVLMIPSSIGNPNAVYSVGCMPVVIIDSPGATSARGDIFMTPSRLDYKLLNPEVLDTLSDWKDIVVSVDIFISSPFWTYKQSGKCESIIDRSIAYLPGDTSFPSTFGKYAGGDFKGEYEEISVDKRNALKELLAGGNSGGAYYQKWNIADLIHLTGSCGSRVGNVGSEDYSCRYTIELPSYSSETLNRQIKDCGNFFLLKSLPADSLATERTVIDIPNDYLGSLLSREAMTDDYHTHDILSSEGTFVYNSRLIMAGVSRYLYSGFNPVSAVSWQNGFMQYNSDYQSASDAFTDASLTYSNCSVCHWVSLTDGEKKLVATNTNETPVVVHYLTPLYVAYPDTRVVQIHAQYANSEYTSFVFGKPYAHPMLNASVMFTGLYPSGSMSSFKEYEPDANPCLCEGNKIYISEALNPFCFPPENICSVGNGKVFGIASARRAMSSGQFGTYPLYAFSDEGIWALNVDSSTGCFSSVQCISSDVCTFPDTITQTDSAVVFISDRGLMEVDGTRVRNLSERLSLPLHNTSLMQLYDRYLEKSGVNALNIPSGRLSDYFTDNAVLVYDYADNHLWVIDTKDKLAFVYSFLSGEWGTADMNYLSELSAHSCKPSTSILEIGGAVFDFSKKSTDPLPALALTRPLRLKTMNEKKRVCEVETMLCNASSSSPGDSAGPSFTTALWGSNDMRTWHLVGVSANSVIDCLSGSPYRYFRIAFASPSISVDTIASCVSVIVDG